MTLTATLADDLLTIANDVCERRWRIADGALQALAFRACGRDWLEPVEGPTTLPRPRPAGAPALTVSRGARHGVEAESLLAELAIGATTYRFQVFAGLAGITVQVSGPPAPTAARAAAADGPTGVELDHAAPAEAAADDLLERLRLPFPHAILTSVALMDRTDGHDNLAQAQEWRLNPCEDLRLRGCLFAVEDPLSGDGLLLLKHAPLPHARPAPCPVDLRARDREVALHGHGAGDTGEGYAWTLLAYRGGGVARTAALHALQRRFRPYVPGRDGRFLSNTWGDRNRDARIAAAFMAQEIAAGERLGVDVVQIDDGWQRGITANSVHREQGGVWQGFWASDAHFWEPHPERFPDGIGATVADARARGMAFGLWFAPDSADEFRNWERDAAAVLSWWRTHGVAYVKIDGVKATTKRGEGNLWRFFRRVLEESRGAVVFDLDVTAEVRPGYFGMMQPGPLFVENRYTDWRRYWPHATLRNLWQLAWWIDPVRLRIEFLNPRRNQDKYDGDPLAPARWRPAALFATTMVANPLGWFETSGLADADAREIADLVRIWRGERDRMHAAAIRPIGSCPDGARWTGFLADGGDALWVVAFRERSPEAAWSIALPDGTWRAQALAGGEAPVDGARLTVRIAEPLGYAFVRLERA